MAAVRQLLPLARIKFLACQVDPEGRFCPVLPFFLHQGQGFPELVHMGNGNGKFRSRFLPVQTCLESGPFFLSVFSGSRPFCAFRLRIFILFTGLPVKPLRHSLAKLLQGLSPQPV